MSDISNSIKTLNPNLYKHCSVFFERKDKADFIIQSENDKIIITASFPKAEPTTNYRMEISAVDCEFVFENSNKVVYVEVLNEFENFEAYFVSDEQNGSTIARLLRNVYREVFADRISAGDDLELDEDFNLYFVDNFVNYILNDVYIE